MSRWRLLLRPMALLSLTCMYMISTRPVPATVSIRSSGSDFAKGGAEVLSQGGAGRKLKSGCMTAPKTRSRVS
eukprot:690057-Prymnesium_polylepis.1